MLVEISVPVLIENDAAPEFAIRCEAVVDSGTRHLVLPEAWREKLGPMRHLRSQQVRLANQDVITGEIYGPVLVKVDGFDYAGTEVLFVPMDPEHEPEALLGHLVLEHVGAAIDFEAGRLVHARAMR